MEIGRRPEFVEAWDPPRASSRPSREETARRCIATGSARSNHFELVACKNVFVLKFSSAPKGHCFCSASQGTIGLLCLDFYRNIQGSPTTRHSEISIFSGLKGLFLGKGKRMVVTHGLG